MSSAERLNAPTSTPNIISWLNFSVHSSPLSSISGRSSVVPVAIESASVNRVTLKFSLGREMFRLIFTLPNLSR